MKVTPGKKKGLAAVSDSRGVIAAAAMDQRGSLKTAFAKEKGIDKKDVTAKMLEEFKTAVTRVLTPHASAILLDPEYGLPAAGAARKMPACCSPTKTADMTIPSPAACPTCSTSGPSAALSPPAPIASRFCSTTRLLIRPTSTKSSMPGSSASAGNAAASDIPFFLEFVGYEEGGDEKGIGFARKKPEIVAREHGGIFEAAIRSGCVEGRSACQHGLRRRHATPVRATRPIRATRPKSISATPPPPRKSPSSICPRA